MPLYCYVKLSPILMVFYTVQGVSKCGQIKYAEMRWGKENTLADLFDSHSNPLILL